MDTRTERAGEFDRSGRGKPGWTAGGEKNQPAAARNLMPPFPGPRFYGTDPRRQGFVAGDIVEERENISSHRAAPLTAPVPFPKTRCISGKGGQRQSAGRRTISALISGKTAAAKPRGLRPCDPARKNIKISLDRRGPSHGRRTISALISGKTAAAKPRGLRPCDPARKNIKISLDRRGPSHGSRDRKGTFPVVGKSRTPPDNYEQIDT